VARLRLEGLEGRAVPAVITVTSLADNTTIDGQVTLREAIQAANTDTSVDGSAAGSGADTIVFAPALADQTVNLGLVGDVSIGPSALLVSTPITIQGTGQTITRTGAAGFRLFAVGGAGDLTLEDLTLSNGLAQGGAAGGGGGAAGLGGAVYNQGDLHVFDCTLTGNQAVSGAGSGGALGGGGRGGAGDAAGDGGGPNGGPAGANSATGTGGTGGTGGSGGFGGGGGKGGTGGSNVVGFGLPGGDGGAGGFGGGGGKGGTGGSGNLELGNGGGGGAGGFGGGGGSGGTGLGVAFGGPGGFGGGFGSDGLGTPGGGGAGLGGAIFNQGGAITVANSTVTGNTAQGGDANGMGAGAGSGFGGGLFNINGSVPLTNVTFARNTVAAGTASNGAIAAGQAAGGAVYNLAINVGSVTPTQTATITVANSILANTTGGSDVVNNQQAGTATLNATGPNIASVAVVNTGGNAGGTVSGTAFTIADPQLGAPAANGGSTQTMAPAAGSPAIDHGSNAVLTAANFGGTAPTTDQRGPGFLRVSDGTADIGAFEVQVPIVVYPPSLPTAEVGTPYDQTINASGPPGPYTFMASGNLDGLSLSSAGALTGTPTAAGMFMFTVTATNGTNESGSRPYTLTVDPAVVVSPATLPTGEVGSPYNQTISASGPPGRFSFAVTTGTLPTGLGLSSGGTLSGTPTAAGTFMFTVTATNSTNESGSQAYTLTVAQPPIPVGRLLAVSGSATGTAVVYAPSAAGAYTTAVPADHQRVPRVHRGRAGRDRGLQRRRGRGHGARHRPGDQDGDGHHQRQGRVAPAAADGPVRGRQLHLRRVRHRRRHRPRRAGRVGRHAGVAWRAAGRHLPPPARRDVRPHLGAAAVARRQLLRDR
jgi:CSLREA domain-containing protein